MEEAASVHTAAEETPMRREGCGEQSVASHVKGNRRRAMGRWHSPLNQEVTSAVDLCCLRVCCFVACGCAVPHPGLRPTSLHAPAAPSAEPFTRSSVRVIEHPEPSYHARPAPPRMSARVGLSVPVTVSNPGSA